MIKKISLFLSLVIVSILTHAQIGQGSIKGKILDKETGEALPFVNVIAERNGNMVTGASTDFDGVFVIKPLAPGKYDIKFKFVGYQEVVLAGVMVNSDQETTLNQKLSKGIQLKTAVIIDFKQPLFKKDETVQKTSLGAEAIDRMATRSATGVAKTVGGIYSKDDGQNKLNARGSRDDANYVYIDGVKVRGSANLPKAALAEVSVITGGLPAQYGDVTGAVISITTKGGARDYAGGIDYLTSGYKIGDKVYGLDAYGYNLLEFNATGPLLWKKDSAGKKTDPLLSFFIAGNATHNVDPAPSAIGMWKVKDDKLVELRENPLGFNPITGGTVLNHEFLRLNDLEKIKTRQNVAAKAVNVLAKLDINTGRNTTLTFGGTIDFGQNRNDNYRSRSANVITGNLLHNTLMNTDANPEFINNTWRVYSRFTQRFGSSVTDEKSASIIKNAYYTLQFDYQQRTQKRQSAKHKDNLFDYGHVGKFTTYKQRTYAPGIDSSLQIGALIHQTFEDTLVAYEAGTVNPDMARITEGYYDLYGWEGFNENGAAIYDYDFAGDALRNLNNIQLGGGLRNGDQVLNGRAVYNMWRTPANVFQNYNLIDENQFRLTALGSADIGDHALTLGFEYEQRVDRTYGVDQPRRLWEIGRQLMNNHITNLDLSSPTLTWIFDAPLIDYERLNAAPGDYEGNNLENADEQSWFDYNVRETLGLNTDGVDFVDFDSHGPETYSIDFFSADEILNGGAQLANWRGYDHAGNKVKNYDPNWLTDFFTDFDENGNYIRAIAPYKPIYFAGFIQDKFSFEDLVFNIGVRIDRFDANQSVLADPYSVFPTVRAGEELSSYIETDDKIIVPSNIGADYVVYVNDVQNPTSIVGYRNESVWFNAEGTEIGDASVLETASGIAPLLVDNSRTRGQQIDASSFKDYKPQVRVMPRIAFSFPISDEATFIAHYDVLTKRPTSGNVLNPIDYYFIESVGGNAISHGNLKPEQTIDYEVGFKQKLSPFSALTLSGFYREMRDMVNVVNLAQAYPNPYITYQNQDFGTVKGTTVSYDLRPEGNFSGRVAYTMQFAEGTGSNATSGLGLARNGKQNLRATIPLGFDQRHTIVANVDYRYGGGKSYNGPIIGGNEDGTGGSRILENFGINLTFSGGSGTPYTASQNVSSSGLFTGQRQLVKGSLNGNRLPWQFVINAGIDKSFDLRFGSGDDAKKLADAKIYMQIDNVLNTVNIVSVYRFTGNADDDGYLTEATFQNDITSQTNEQAFRELYNIKINNGSMFTLPRRLKFGIRLNF